MNLHYLVPLLDLPFTVYKAVVWSYRRQGSEIDQQLRFVDYAISECGFVVVKPGKSFSRQKEDAIIDLTVRGNLRSARAAGDPFYHCLTLVYWCGRLLKSEWRWSETGGDWRDDYGRTRFLFLDKTARDDQGDYNQSRAAFMDQFRAFVDSH
jgi:hypothetical protein